jgi:hypothetical protein
MEPKYYRGVGAADVVIEFAGRQYTITDQVARDALEARNAISDLP